MNFYDLNFKNATIFWNGMVNVGTIQEYDNLADWTRISKRFYTFLGLGFFRLFWLKLMPQASHDEHFYNFFLFLLFWSVLDVLCCWIRWKWQEKACADFIPEFLSFPQNGLKAGLAFAVFLTFSSVQTPKETPDAILVQSARYSWINP